MLPQEMEMQSIDLVNILLCGKNSIRQSGVPLTPAGSAVTRACGHQEGKLSGKLIQ